MGSGCNVPAIQAARTIESRQDRLITILVTPLVSCSARLQIYIVIAGTFFTPIKAAMVIVAMHFLGLGLAVLMGRLLRSALFTGLSSPFVMELPPYRLPVLKSTLVHMWEKGSVFLSRAGTTIFAGATLVWFLSRYPGIANPQWTEQYLQQRQAVLALQLPQAVTDSRLRDLDLARESRIVNSSLAARLGQKVAPILQPILDPDHRPGQRRTQTRRTPEPPPGVPAGSLGAQSPHGPRLHDFHPYLHPLPGHRGHDPARDGQLGLGRFHHCLWTGAGVGPGLGDRGGGPVDGLRVRWP
jgi:hypothetical protein